LVEEGREDLRVKIIDFSCAMEDILESKIDIQNYKGTKTPEFNT